MNPTRRQLILAAASAMGGAALLAACNDDEGAKSTATDNTSPSDGTVLDKGYYLVQRFPSQPLFIPGEESRHRSRPFRPRSASGNGDPAGC